LLQKHGSLIPDQENISEAHPRAPPLDTHCTKGQHIRGAVSQEPWGILPQTCSSMARAGSASMAMMWTRAQQRLQPPLHVSGSFSGACQSPGCWSGRGGAGQVRTTTVGVPVRAPAPSPPPHLKSGAHNF